MLKQLREHSLLGVQKQGGRPGWDPFNEIMSNTAGVFENRKEWTDIITAHVQMLRFMCNGESQQAFEHIELAVAPFSKVITLLSSKGIL